MEILTIKEFASSGGKARWKGISPEQRSKIMKKVRKGGKKVIHKQVQKVVDEQAR